MTKKLLYLAPDGFPLPPDFDLAYETGVILTVKEDRFEWADAAPNEAYPLNAGEEIAEVREFPHPSLEGAVQYRMRIRYDVQKPELRGGSAPVAHLGKEGVSLFWVVTDDAKAQILNDYLETEAGDSFAGLIAVEAAQNLLGLTRGQVIQRIVSLRSWLSDQGYNVGQVISYIARLQSNDPTADDSELARIICEVLGVPYGRLQAVDLVHD